MGGSADYTYVDGLLEGAKLQFIADKADGTRVLLCGWFDGSEGWGLTESTPLPAGTEIGIENFVDTLNLGLKGYGVSIGRRADGKWGAVGALGEDYFALGSCWVSDGDFVVECRSGNRHDAVERHHLHGLGIPSAQHG